MGALDGDDLLAMAFSNDDDQFGITNPLSMVHLSYHGSCDYILPPAYLSKYEKFGGPHMEGSALEKRDQSVFRPKVIAALEAVASKNREYFSKPFEEIDLFPTGDGAVIKAKVDGLSKAADDGLVKFHIFVTIRAVEVK